MELPEEYVREIVNSIYVRGEIPLKFQYIGEGAKFWDRLSRKRKEDEHFGHFEIEETAEEVMRRADDDIYLVDLGCGNGDPAEIIVRRLLEKGVNVTYVPVDISPELLQMASDRIRRLGVEVRPHLLDFDKEPIDRVFSELGDKPAHILLLGNTLGNHSNELKILVNIRDAMRRGDLLYLGLYMYSPFRIGSVAKSYYDEDVWGVVTNIPKNLFGINPEDLEMRIDVGNVGGKRQVLAFLELKRDYNISIRDYRLQLRRGDRMLVIRSVRYTPTTIASMMEEAEFRFVHFSENEDATVSLSVVVPRKIW